MGVSCSRLSSPKTRLRCKKALSEVGVVEVVFAIVGGDGRFLHELSR